MKAYRIQREVNKFYVYETTTNQRITQYNDYEQANGCIQELNRGKGFSGNTPMFFTRSGLESLQNISYSMEDELE